MMSITALPSATVTELDFHPSAVRGTMPTESGGFVETSNKIVQRCKLDGGCLVRIPGLSFLNLF
jgi:hypothetical protein